MSTSKKSSAKPAAMSVAAPAVVNASRYVAKIATQIDTPNTPVTPEFPFNSAGAETPLFFVTGSTGVEVYGRRLNSHQCLFHLVSATDLHEATLRHFSDTHSSEKKLAKLKLRTPAMWLAKNKKVLSPLIDALGDAHALSYRHLVDDEEGPFAANRDFAVYLDGNGVWMCAALLARYAAWLSKAHDKCFAANYVIR